MVISKFMWRAERIMGKSGRGRMSEEEERNLFDKVLKEDNEEAVNEGTKSDTTEDSSRICDCMRIAEHSSRFSLRVMEAMRSLQRKEDTFLPSCTAEDIVRYIEANYRDDGDLYAQVRTALKQVCSQGFVMELLENEYHLVGPDAISMNRVTCSSRRADCLLSSTPKPPAKRQKKDEDDCTCEPSTDESRSRRRRKSSRKTGRGARTTRRNRTAERIDDVEIGEDHDKEEEDIIDPDYDDNREPIGAQGSAKAGIGEASTKDSGIARYSPLNFFRRRNESNQERSSRRENGGRRTRETARNETSKKSKQNEEDNVTEETLSDRLDNVHQQSQHRTQRRKDNEREKELKRWIKHCQAECVRRGKRRTDN